MSSRYSLDRPRVRRAGALKVGRAQGTSRTGTSAVEEDYNTDNIPVLTRAEVHSARLTTVEQSTADELVELLLMLGLDPDNVESSRFIESCS